MADARAAWQRAVVPAAPVADLFHRIGLATPTLGATLANVVQTSARSRTSWSRH